jgi:transcriptional regulator with XRE-family HTH domain
MTLADLSAATGISVSTLSRLESGQRRPNLELLLPLARAHRVPLDELVGAPPTGDPRIHAQPFTRNGMSFQPLTRQPGGLQAYKVVIPTSRARREPDLQVHEGYEWLYVLTGQVRLVLGEHDLVLRAGEAAEFDTRLPHWFDRADSESGELLIRKTRASAFYGTALSAYLVQLGVDTLVICGNSTSGCVRASVNEAFMHGYSVAIVEDGVFDRNWLSHKVNLYDMNTKYGDVIFADEAVEYITSHAGWPTSAQLRDDRTLRPPAVAAR